MEQFLTKMKDLVEEPSVYVDYVRPHLLSESSSGRLFLYACLSIFVHDKVWRAGTRGPSEAAEGAETEGS